MFNIFELVKLNVSYYCLIKTQIKMETEELKQKIKLHLKLLVETNMYTKEMDVTTLDLYNLFRVHAQQVSGEKKKVIKDALKMLCEYDRAIMKYPNFKTPHSVIHGKITSIIHRLKTNSDETN